MCHAIIFVASLKWNPTLPPPLLPLPLPLHTLRG
jgi:hypothetical protein